MPKSKYETHVLPFLDKIEKMARKGATAKEIAKKLNVAYSSFKKYMDLGRKGDQRYADLAALYAQACEEPDDNVEASLYKLSTGYTTEVIKHYKIKRIEYDPDTGKRIAEYEELVPAKDEVHVPANVMAQRFWLTNRRGDRWKNEPANASSAADDEGGVIVIPAVEEASGEGKSDGKA